MGSLFINNSHSTLFKEFKHSDSVNACMSATVATYNKCSVHHCSELSVMIVILRDFTLEIPRGVRVYKLEARFFGQMGNMSVIMFAA